MLFNEINNVKISYKSKSGSQYIFSSDGLYRISNHWGRVANCHWRLIPLDKFKSQKTIVGFANWTDFYSNNDNSKLFFIKVDFETQEVNFYHKLSAEIQEKIVLRNAKETAKTIQTIKMVLNEKDWARHLKYQDLEVFRKMIVNELIYSEKRFIEIKRQYL